jgi:hypothetical protein
MNTVRRSRLAVTAACLSTAASAALAGPPFLTDDPEPLEYKHSEAYLFSTIDKANDEKSAQLPALEFNHSPYPDVHLHLVVPVAESKPSDAGWSSGLGDIEVGVKYRLVHETETRPQVGFFPMAELPTGDGDRGLGNGRVWWKLPLWIQKSWGKWTTYGGGGRAFNSAPGMSNYNFGGWLLQRELSESLTLGGEIFAQGATAEDGEHTTIANFGGYYTPRGGCGDCRVLFSLGHSIAGEVHTVGYLGLYWALAPKGE